MEKRQIGLRKLFKRDTKFIFVAVIIILLIWLAALSVGVTTKAERQGAGPVFTSITVKTVKGNVELDLQQLEIVRRQIAELERWQEFYIEQMKIPNMDDIFPPNSTIEKLRELKVIQKNIEEAIGTKLYQAKEMMAGEKVSAGMDVAKARYEATKMINEFLDALKNAGRISAEDSSVLRNAILKAQQEARIVETTTQATGLSRFFQRCKTTSGRIAYKISPLFKFVNIAVAVSIISDAANLTPEEKLYLAAQLAYEKLRREKESRRLLEYRPPMEVMEFLFGAALQVSPTGMSPWSALVGELKKLAAELEDYPEIRQEMRAALSKINYTELRDKHYPDVSLFEIAKLPQIFD